MPDNTRQAEAAVDPMFLDRWSPRAFRSSPLHAGQLASLFEAVRWAPSCFNEQPWVIVHGHGVGSEDHSRVLSVLVESNQAWARHAPLLMILFARRRFTHNDHPNRHAGFDAGAGWMALALQARRLGLHSHAMAGFDAARAYAELGVPEADYEAMAAIAVGERGDASELPEKLQARETPNDRRKTSSFVHAGRFAPTDAR